MREREREREGAMRMIDDEERGFIRSIGRAEFQNNPPSLPQGGIDRRVYTSFKGSVAYAYFTVLYMRQKMNCVGYY